jgi:hypothetical protein
MLLVRIYRNPISKLSGAIWSDYTFTMWYL